jgi:hypothetical protein
MRCASVVAPLTEICWPNIARIENSKISQQLGRRKPGSCYIIDANFGYY